MNDDVSVAEEIVARLENTLAIVVPLEIWTPLDTSEKLWRRVDNVVAQVEALRRWGEAWPSRALPTRERLIWGASAAREGDRVLVLSGASVNPAIRGRQGSVVGITRYTVLVLLDDVDVLVHIPWGWFALLSATGGHRKSDYARLRGREKGGELIMHGRYGDED